MRHNENLSPMLLKDWIKLKGVPEVARLLNVNENTVRYWGWGTTPRPKQMRAIKKATNGRVGYEEMIEGRLRKESTI